jgi:hypothetical protein
MIDPGSVSSWKHCRPPVTEDDALGHRASSHQQAKYCCSSNPVYVHRSTSLASADMTFLMSIVADFEEFVCKDLWESSVNRTLHIHTFERET